MAKYTLLKQEGTARRGQFETVKYKVESFTGMKIKKINIYVEGVRVID